MTLCPFESLCVFANAERPDADDLILREVFCDVRPSACTIFSWILENRVIPEGMRPTGYVRGFPRVPEELCQT